MTRMLENTYSPEPDSGEFQAKLNEITSRELDARTIDTYADDALAGLIALVEGALVLHGSQDSNLSGTEKERLAITDVGLNPNTVEMTLDHIADVAESIKRMDGLIEKKTKFVDMVIVPPESGEARQITTGSGSFENPRESVPKLKALLLLLEKGLDVEVENENEVLIISGKLSSSSMRSVSYNLVDIPSLSRVVLVCDEIGNVTYVFDKGRCEDHGIGSIDLMRQNKPELNQLIDEDELIGKRVIYSSNYVDTLASTLVNPFEITKSDNAHSISILEPRELLDSVPEGWKTVTELTAELSLSRMTITRTIASFNENEFGIVRYCKTAYQKIRLFSPEQQESIRLACALDELPPEFITFQAMANELGIDKATLRSRVINIGNEFDEILHLQLARMGNKTKVLSPTQQKTLREGGGLLGIREYVIPDGYATIKEMAGELNLSEEGIHATIGRLRDDDFGTVEVLEGTRCNIYNLEQQKKIREASHLNKIDSISEGEKTYEDLYNEFQIGRTGLWSRINAIDKAEFGEIRYFYDSDSKRMTAVLDHHQVKLLREQDKRRKSK